MKRYMVFSVSRNGKRGGMADIYGIFDTLEDVYQAIFPEHYKHLSGKDAGAYNHIQLVDLELGTWVKLKELDDLKKLMAGEKNMPFYVESTKYNRHEEYWMKRW